MKQNPDPTPEEELQNDAIALLQGMYACEDRSCKNLLCYPMPPDGKHLPMHHMHLNTWAAGIVRDFLAFSNHYLMNHDLVRSPRNPELTLKPLRTLSFLISTTMTLQISVFSRAAVNFLTSPTNLPQMS